MRLPTEAEIDCWHRALLTDREFAPALDHLVNARGLDLATIGRLRIGYRMTTFGHRIPEPAFTIPVTNADRKLLNLRQRTWPGPKRYLGLTGRGSHLYPLPMVGPYRIVCEGEFDAAIGRRHKLPTVSGTAGTYFAPEWIDQFNRRLPIFICFDPEGYHERAVPLARLFREAGHGLVWPVNLGMDGRLGCRRGLRPKEDLTDWFVKHGRDATQLRRFIQAERLRGARS
jgi:hypothetical protein